MLKIAVYGVLVLGSYLLGSVSPAIIITKLFYKDDVRNWGSKSAGATNVFRNYDKAAGAAVLGLDIVKGIVIIALERLICHWLLVPRSLHVEYLCFIAAVLGHCFPAFFGFKGGKAIAVACGCLLVLNPILDSLALAVFIAVLTKTRVVGISSVCAAGSLAPLSLILALVNGRIGWDFAYILVIAAILIFAHRGNIKGYWFGKGRELIKREKLPE